MEEELEEAVSGDCGGLLRIEICFGYEARRTEILSELYTYPGHAVEPSAGPWGVKGGPKGPLNGLQGEPLHVLRQPAIPQGSDP